MTAQYVFNIGDTCPNNPSGKSHITVLDDWHTWPTVVYRCIHCGWAVDAMVNATYTNHTTEEDKP